MNTIIIILLSLSILLFIISFFQKDRVKELEQEIEHLSINVLQEQFKFKKRIQVLEEELLVNEDHDLPKTTPSQEPNEILKNHVLALHNQGLEVNQISKQSSLPIDTVVQIINEHQGL